MAPPPVGPSAARRTRENEEGEYDRLADEFMAAFRKEGKAMATRDQTHRMADANKAFAHFAW